MNTLSASKMNRYLNILDLPDEILLIICNKMNMIDVLYSLVDVNQRFDRLVLDPFTIRNLDMTNRTFASTYNPTFSIDEKIFSKICDQILYRISDQINGFTIEQNSMNRILSAANYSQLYSLSLVNFEAQILNQYLTGIVIN